MLTRWLKQQPDRCAAQQRLLALKLQIAEAKDLTDYARQHQQLLAESAQVWGVDVYFIRRSVLERARETVSGKQTARRDEMNIALAVTLEPLRRLLAMDLLDDLLKRR